MHPAVSSERETLAELCRRFHVRRLEVFGSATRDQDVDPLRSDADFLIKFEPDADPTSAGLLDIKEALEQALQRKVDLIAIEQSRKDLRRQRIVQEAEQIFVAE